MSDPGSALKRGVKVCKRPLVNEVIGLLLTEFFPDPTHKGATPIQRGLYSSLLVCIKALEPIRHGALGNRRSCNDAHNLQMLAYRETLHGDTVAALRYAAGTRPRRSPQSARLELDSGNIAVIGNEMSHNI